MKKQYSRKQITEAVSKLRRSLKEGWEPEIFDPHGKFGNSKPSETVPDGIDLEIGDVFANADLPNYLDRIAIDAAEGSAADIKRMLDRALRTREVEVTALSDKEPEYEPPEDPADIDWEKFNAMTDGDDDFIEGRLEGLPLRFRLTREDIEKRLAKDYPEKAPFIVTDITISYPEWNVKFRPILLNQISRQDFVLAASDGSIPLVLDGKGNTLYRYEDGRITKCGR